jgi:hypothetical protein
MYFMPQEERNLRNIQMTMQSLPRDAMPSLEEVRALIARAHQERNRAIRGLIGGLFLAGRSPRAETAHAHDHTAAACG